MAEVIRLAPFQNADTVALLRALTIAATNGDVIGLQAEVRFKGGRTSTCASGTYARQIPQAADGTDPSTGN